jgi:glycosyltransferase involved in cell wall biosynthesis
MEGLPFSLLEAMAAGKPVIGSRVPGVTDLIRQADTGLTYPLGDSDTLADHLASLMGDPALRQRLGQAGRHLVRRAFLAGPMVASTANLYDRLLQATGAQKYGQTVG